MSRFADDVVKLNAVKLDGGRLAAAVAFYESNGRPATKEQSEEFPSPTCDACHQEMRMYNISYSEAGHDDVLDKLKDDEFERVLSRMSGEEISALSGPKTYEYRCYQCFSWSWTMEGHHVDMMHQMGDVVCRTSSNIDSSIDSKA